MKKKTKQQLKQQLIFFAISLAMIPFCWLLLILFFVFVTPQITSDSNGQNWGRLLLMSLMFSLIPGVFMAGASYFLMQTFLRKK